MQPSRGVKVTSVATALWQSTAQTQLAFFKFHTSTLLPSAEANTASSSLPCTNFAIPSLYLNGLQERSSAFFSASMTFTSSPAATSINFVSLKLGISIALGVISVFNSISPLSRNQAILSFEGQSAGGLVDFLYLISQSLSSSILLIKPSSIITYSYCLLSSSNAAFETGFGFAIAFVSSSTFT